MLDMNWPVPVYGGQGLNVVNRESAAFYTALGTKRLTASLAHSLSPSAMALH